eukprot:16451687-Heterocapsa_arctica.AAC.1
MATKTAPSTRPWFAIARVMNSTPLEKTAERNSADALSNPAALHTLRTAFCTAAPPSMPSLQASPSSSVSVSHATLSAKTRCNSPATTSRRTWAQKEGNSVSSFSNNGASQASARLRLIRQELSNFANRSSHASSSTVPPAKAAERRRCARRGKRPPCAIDHSFTSSMSAQRFAARPAST